MKYICNMTIDDTYSPYLICGPCGVESLEQMQLLGTQLAPIPINMIRGGVWKPRSKPGHFEGRGELGLQWLKEAGKIANKPICTEVANKQQVALALQYDIDAVWIGARTTVNPFLVQEICDSLQGSKVTVMVKNPVNPDVELWSGAIERLQKSNVVDIKLIHRGFSVYDTQSEYRNKPIWAIPIEMKRRYSHIPIICDISHISGKTSLLQSVAQRAMDLDFDGLMIETHPSPEKALSDAQQQITPATLHALLNQLQYCTPHSEDAQWQIEEMRHILDTIDAEIVGLLGKRMNTARNLGDIKIANDISIFQLERWRAIVDSRREWAVSQNLSPDFIYKIFELIHNTSIQLQLDRKNILRKK